MLTSRRFLWLLSMVLGGLMMAVFVGLLAKEIGNQRRNAGPVNVPDEVGPVAAEAGERNPQPQPKLNLIRDPRTGKELLIGDTEGRWLQTCIEDDRQRSVTFREQRIPLVSFCEGRFGRLTIGSEVMEGFYQENGLDYRILDLKTLRAANASVALTKVELRPNAAPAKWYRTVLGFAADDWQQIGKVARELAKDAGAAWEARDLARRALLYNRLESKLYPIAGVEMKAGELIPLPAKAKRNAKSNDEE